MKTGKNGIDLIKKYEGCKLEAYLCPANVLTIGYGNTFYEDNKPIKKGDKITQERAEELLQSLLPRFEKSILKLVKTKINQNQFDSLVSFTWNLGEGNLSTSTLLKKININPNDKTIEDEFNKWTKAGGKVLSGLIKRRESEHKLYFKEI